MAGSGRLGAAFAGAFLARCSRSGVTPRYGWGEVWWLDRRELKLPATMAGSGRLAPPSRVPSSLVALAQALRRATGLNT